MGLNRLVGSKRGRTISGETTMTIANQASATPIQSTLSLLQNRVAAAKAKQAEKAEHLEEQGYDAEAIEELQQEAEQLRNEVKGQSQPHRGRPSNSIVELVQAELFSGESAGHYTKSAIKPGSKMPRAITRFPFFVPHQRFNQKDLVGEDLSMAFETPWGRGRKFGSALNVDDEDVFLSLGRLQQYELRGDTSLMPIKVQDPLRRGRKASVHTLVATPGMIREQLGLKKSGANNAKIIDSIKRLASTRVELEAISGMDQYRGAVFSLFDVAWERFDNDGVFYIQFSPVISDWFENAFTWIDWDVRMALPNGASKAVHRFLSGQPKEYEIGAQKLKDTILYKRPMKDFLRELRAGFKEMKASGWLKEGVIEGTGRRVPFKIRIER